MTKFLKSSRSSHRASYVSPSPKMAIRQPALTSGCLDYHAIGFGTAKAEREVWEVVLVGHSAVERARSEAAFSVKSMATKCNVAIDDDSACIDLVDRKPTNK